MASIATLPNGSRHSEVALTHADIVRHALVQRIVQAYDEGPKKRR